MFQSNEVYGNFVSKKKKQNPRKLTISERDRVYKKNSAVCHDEWRSFEVRRHPGARRVKRSSSFYMARIKHETISILLAFIV